MILSLKDKRRFWEKVNKNGPVPRKDCGCKGKCHEYITNGSGPNGYMQIRIAGKLYRVHRVAWTLCRGEIPKGLWVLHKCDNPICVNPEHLFLGTKFDNVRDRQSKGRQVKGEGLHTATLTEEAVIELRRMYRKGSRKYGATALAKKFGVTSPTIRDAVNYVTWKHVK